MGMFGRGVCYECTPDGEQREALKRLENLDMGTGIGTGAVLRAMTDILQLIQCFPSRQYDAGTIGKILETPMYSQLHRQIFQQIR